jgi:RNA polymerase sigma factor (TIGR02999 family)
MNPRLPWKAGGQRRHKGLLSGWFSCHIQWRYFERDLVMVSFLRLHVSESVPMREDVTGFLRRSGQGDQAAYDTLLPVVYGELKRLARGFMAHERDDHTLQTTALIHEAFLRLFEFRDVQWQDREHFLRVAARAMRRVLVDHARGRNRVKRGGGAERLPMDQVADEAVTFFGCPDLDILALNIALDRLEADYPRQARVVEFLFFAGLTHPEVAEVLKVSPKTVERDWLFARAWLICEMERPRGRPQPLSDHEPPSGGDA